MKLPIILASLVFASLLLFTTTQNTPQGAAIAQSLPSFTFKQQSLQVTEGQSARITVVAPANLSRTTRVTYSITPQGGATVNKDYRLPSTRTLTFYKGGLKEKSIVIPTITDTITESNEAFTVKLGGSTATVRVGILERGGGAGATGAGNTFPGVSDAVAFGKVLPSPQPVPAGCKVPPTNLAYTNAFGNTSISFNGGNNQAFELPNASIDPRFKFVDVKDLYAGANQKIEGRTGTQVVDEWPADYNFMTGTNAAGQKFERRLGTFGDIQNVAVFFVSAPGTYHSVRFVASPTGRENMLTGRNSIGGYDLVNTVSTRSAPSAVLVTISECPGDFDTDKLVDLSREEIRSKTDAELVRTFKNPAIARASVEELGSCRSQPSGLGSLGVVVRGGILDTQIQGGAANKGPACRLIPGKTYYRNVTVGTKQYGYFLEMQQIKATIANILDVPYINAYCFNSKRDAENPEYDGVCTSFLEERLK